MNDQELMQSIKTKWGAEIDRAVGVGSASFLAALVANETGGNPNATRFEKNVLASLWNVLLARVPHFGSIDRAAVLAYLGPSLQQAPSGAYVTSDFFDTCTRFDSLATSYGLTQIMGYQILGKHKGATIDTLKTPATSLAFTTLLLNDFAAEFQLNLLNDFADLFRCWNTGRPNGTTFDPAYVPNGLARKAIYEALP